MKGLLLTKSFQSTDNWRSELKNEYENLRKERLLKFLDSIEKIKKKLK